MQNKCAEIKIRAERRAGELIKEGQENGTIADKGRPKLISNDTIINSKAMPARLPELDITLDESSRWQTLAEMPINNLKPLPPAFYRP